MRLAVAQINTVLGDFAGNRKKIVEYIHQAHQQSCDLVVFPEATLFGYHPFDLLEQRNMVSRQMKELQTLQTKIPAGISVLVGLFTPNSNKKGRPYFNSVALLKKSARPVFFHKQLLPTGDVFDEARFIESGVLKRNHFSVRSGGRTYKGFLTICEDIWAWPEKNGSSQYPNNPLTEVKGKFDFVINMSASPFYPGKLKRREELVHATAKTLKAPMVYCNLVGGQDEIIFDGASFALLPNGKKVLQCDKFKEDFRILDLSKKNKISDVKSKSTSVAHEIREALVLGLRDFCHKTGLQKVHLGLSGGVDSALVACLAVESLGSENVQALYLPGPYSSDLSEKLAHQLAHAIGIKIRNVPVTPVFESLQKTLIQQLQWGPFGVADENIQARLRGLILMALSNSENSMLLTTGNKSEYATGYSTLYGDMCGGLAPIADLTKKQVYSVSRTYNEAKKVIPDEILSRAPTAELRPNQKDQDSLPEYSVLDKAVERIVEDCEPARNETEKWLTQVLARTEFKRWQAAPILKVSRHSFGRGRRYPIAFKA